MDLAYQISEFNRLTGEIDPDTIKEFACNIADTIKQHGSIYICGNGGSASSASLFASLLIQAGFKINHRINAISLNSNMVTLSALANQYGYQNIYNIQLYATAKKNDLLIVISGSGSSPNILAVVKAAQEMGLGILGLTGSDGGKLKGLIDKVLFAPTNNMEQIETIHYVYFHCILRWLELCFS